MVPRSGVLAALRVDILVVAGEASGDLHAANLVAALKARHPEVRLFGMGGEKLKAQGVELLFGSHEISVMGIAEVVPKIPRILHVLSKLAAAAAERKPVCALLVDVPDFNLRLATRLKALGIKVVWYISPMVWAWRKDRVKRIAQLVDRMLCILPFEERFYAETQVSARYVGNPLLDAIPPVAPASTFREQLGLPLEGKVLALLPGSRKSEISRILPTLVASAQVLAAKKPGLRCVVPVAPGLARASIEAPFVEAGVAVTLIDGQAAQVVGACDVAVVASGTATLEAALMHRPLIAVYRLSLLSYAVGRALVKLEHFSLVNLLLRRRAIPELLQGDFTPERVAQHVDALWEGAERERLLGDLTQLRSVLGPAGASERAAEELWAVATGEKG